MANDKNTATQQATGKQVSATNNTQEAATKTAASEKPRTADRNESAPALKTGTARKAAAKAKAARKAPARKTAPKKVRITAQKAKTASGKTKTTASTRTKPTNNKIMETTMPQGKAQFEKLAQQAAHTGQEQVEACIKSGNIFFKGWEEIVKTCWSLAQDSAEKNSQAVKNLLACKTLNELTETQNKLAQQNFDDLMTGATKLSELSIKVTTDAFEPINDQFSKSLKKAG